MRLIDRYLSKKTIWLGLLLTAQSLFAQDVISINGSDGRHGHQTGFAQGTSWATNVTQRRNVYLTFGPYITGVGSGFRSARYFLSVDNATSDNLLLATIDVYDAANNRVLGTRQITRRMFSVPPYVSEFAIDFTSQANSMLEFRVYYHGNTAMTHFKTEVITQREALNRQMRSANAIAANYAIQDVCVDSQDRVIAGDPATCALKRDVRIGEKIPYILTDYDFVWGVNYQAVSSFPVVGADNTVKVMVSKNNKTRHDFNFVFDYQEARDGYDLIDLSGSILAFIRTSDGGCFDQKISMNRTVRNQGWQIFPQNMSSGSNVHNTTIERLTPYRPANCAAISSGTAYDVWNAPVPVAFESGKVLTAQVNYHFAAQNLSAVENALERYYFTKEYGFTKWEAWIPKARCFRDKGAGNPECEPKTNPNHFMRGRCNPATSEDIWGGQVWVRLDCRDTTFYQAIATPAIQLSPLMGTMNGLIDVNFSATMNGF
jgi:hypothetical protein